MAPCQEGVIRAGIILAARDEDLARFRMGLWEELAGWITPWHILWLGTFRVLGAGRPDCQNGGCWGWERKERETPSLPPPIPQGG